jgi:hypothetical protein
MSLRSTGLCHLTGSRMTLWVSLAFGTLCSSQGAVKESYGFHPPRACSIGSGFRGDTAFLAQSRTGKAANATTSSRDLQLGALGGAPDIPKKPTFEGRTGATGLEESRGR